MNQSNVIHTERCLQSCHLIELIQHYTCVCITFHVNNYTHTVTVRLIIRIRDTLYFLIVHKVSDVFNQFCLVYIIRYLGYYDLIMRLSGFYFSFCTHNYTSTTCQICFTNTAYTIYISACRKVWSFNKFHQLFYRNFRIIDICITSIDYFRKIMRRHVGSHTYSNTGCTIY